MAMCRRVSVLIGRKDKIKGIEGSSKGDLKKIHATKVQHPTILSKSRHLKPDATHDVTTWDTQMNSRCNLKVTSLESPVKTEVEEAYEGEDEHEDLTSIKRELSDFDLQVHEAVASKRGYDPTVASTQLHPASAVLNSQCGYSSDILELKQGNTLRHRRSPSPASSSGEYFSKSGKDKTIDNTRWSRFHEEKNFDFQTQNQWVAFSTESPSFNRVDEWVKDLENQQPPSEEDFVDDNIENTVLPPPDVDRPISKSTTQLTRHQDGNLSKDILYANSVVQSLNPASAAAHISGIGIKAIPAITHFSSLRSVNLSNNFIVHITPGFLPKGLHTLNLSRNKISTIEGLRELTRLRVLDLSYNRISRIGQGLSNCTPVKELYLVGNKISDVEGLHRLLKLTGQL
ncbi:hypothetical protein P8452_28254 [Trifolium repens]|nr:hypothetical protein P8452_28254 [Trifolium repens]